MEAQADSTVIRVPRQVVGHILGKDGDKGRQICEKYRVKLAVDKAGMISRAMHGSGKKLTKNLRGTERS